MRLTIVWRLLSLVALTLALGEHGLAQEQRDLRYGGVVNDYTANFDGGGAWHIMGEWSMSVKGNSRKGTFSVGITMARADAEPRSFHTHHITLDDGEVTALSNGYRISGVAVMSGNGSLAGFNGSPVTVELTGGNALPFSNLAITFAGGAVNHFGSGTIKGVVTQEH
jgi:hypothetical protein